MKNEWKQSGKVKYERTYVFTVSPIMVRFCNNFETKKNLYFILCSWQIIEDKKKDGFPSQSSSKEDQRAPTKRKEKKNQRREDSRDKAVMSIYSNNGKIWNVFFVQWPVCPAFNLYLELKIKSVRTLFTQRERDRREKRVRMKKADTESIILIRVLRVMVVLWFIKP